jgi:hypothetical protein
VAAWKFSKRTITAVGRIICGDAVDGAPLSPYRSGPKLVEFFNELGFDDAYPRSGGFPSRWSFAEDRLSELNGKPKIGRAVEAALEPINFVDTTFTSDAAVEYLNRYLTIDGFELRAVGKKLRLVPLEAGLVSVETPLEARKASHEFISEQLQKCDRKLQDGDYDGGITNARSLLEAVLTDIEKRLCPTPVPYDGDLPKLYKRVQKLLNLEPGQQDLADSLRQILSGLISVVSGLGALRNRVSDAHVRTYKPDRHHAKLAINASKTMTDFLFDTFEHQKRLGRIHELPDDDVPF